MRYATLKQTKIIQGSTADEFQDRLNKALEEVAQNTSKYELLFNNNAGLCAYVVYEVRKEYAETIADEYELKGMKFHCSDCPMYVLAKDKRVLYTTCKRGVRGCKANGDACDWLYEELEKGGIELNEEPRAEESDPCKV